MTGFSRTFFVIWLSLMAGVLALGVFVATAFAEPSYTINYQGKLSDSIGVTVANGTYQLVFKLYTAPTGGAAIWTETRSGGNEVTVQNGLFSVMLGSVTSIASVNFNQPLYLGVTVEADSEMTPRKLIGSVPSAFQAKQLGGVASTSFLRSDQADSASSLLTFTGGLISNSSTTIKNLSTTNATTTSLYIGGDRITDFTGTGLAMSGTSLTASLGTDIAAAEIANGDHGFFSYSSGVASLDSGGLTSTNLSDALTNETGTGGAAVFASGPTLTGTTNLASFIASGSSTISRATFTTATTTNLVVGGERFTDLTGSGLAISSNALTVSLGNDFITPNNIKTSGQTDEYCLTYEASGTTWEWQTCGSAGSSDFLGLSDVPNSYTDQAIFFSSGSQTFFDTDFKFSSSTNRLTVGTATFGTTGFSFAGAATTTLVNNNPYAFTFATSSTAHPLFRIDTTTGGESVQIGAIGGDVYIGAVGNGSDLIFEESSVISGQGGNRITLGVAGDKINFGTGINVGFGTTTPNQAIGIFRSAADSAVEFSSASGANYKWSMGIDYSDAGKFKISSSSALGTNDKLTIDGRGRVDILGDGSGAVTLNVTGAIQATSIYAPNGADLRTTSVVVYTGSGSVATPEGSYAMFTTNDSNTNGAFSGVHFEARNSSNIYQRGYIGVTSISGGAQYTPHMAFGLQTGAATYQEYLRLTSAGSFGIGTTSPWKKLSVAGDMVLTGRLFDSLASAGTNGMILQTTGSATRWVATSSLNLAASAIANDSLDFAQFQDTLDLDANTTINGDDDVSQFGLTMSSDLSVAARSSALLTLTQASNGSNDFDGASTGMLNITNSDAGSDTALLYLSQGGAAGRAINIAAALNTTASIVFVEATGITSGKAIDLSTGSSISGFSTAFTGDYISVGPTRIQSGATTISDTGNFLDLNRTNVVNNAGGTFNITGDLATLSSTLTETSGTITDSSNILSLAQNCGTNADCTGTVLELTNAGTGNGADFFMTNTAGTQTNGLYLRRNGAGGTTSNGIQIASDAGTLTTALLIADGAGTIGTGIQLTGTFSTNLLDTPSLDISAAGAITGATGITSTGLTSVANLIASASSTIARATFVTATTTNLVVNGERFTDLTGTGLVFSANTLTASLGTNIAAAEIADGDHGFFSYSSGVAALDTGGLTSANLFGALTNETGSGAGTPLAVFSESPTIVTPTFTTNATVPLIYGGTGAGSSLSLQSTSGNGTSDFIRFLVGNAGATEAGRFTTAGRLGLGTTTPNQTLTLYTAVASGDNAIEFSGASGSTYKWTMGMDNGTGAFKISSSSVLGTNDRLVIAGNGYVGIGTSSPAFPLDVTGTINSATGFRIAGTGTSGANYLSQFTTTASQTYLDYNGGLHIRNKPSLAGAVSETFTILSGGAVGIGTTTPGSSGEKLSVYHGSDSYANFVDGAGRIVTIGTVASANQGFVGTQSNHAFSVRTNNTARLTITTSGSVGIGTTTPNQKLGIFASAADAAIELSSASGSSYKWTAGIDYSDAGKFKISSSSALGTNDRFVIDGRGYIGVGTASPQALIDVNLGAGYSTRINDGSIQFGVPADATWNATIGFQNYGSGDSFFIRTYGGTVMTADDQAGGVYLWSNGTRRFTVANNGNVGIGTTTPNQALTLFRSAADAAIEFSSLTGSPYKWTAGIDYSDAGKFKISSSSALGTNDRFVINGNGNVGINNSSPLAKLDVITDAASRKGLIVKGASNQTASIFEVQDSAGAAILTVNGTTTPALSVSQTNTGSTWDKAAVYGHTVVNTTDGLRHSAVKGLTYVTANNTGGGQFVPAGVMGIAGPNNTNNVAGVAGLYGQTLAINGTTTDAYDLYAATPFTSYGKLTNQYGLYIAAQTVNDSALGYDSVTNQWGIYQASSGDINYFAGNVGIGDTTPTALLTVGNGDLFTINTSGVITSSNNITPNSVKSAGQTDEYCLTYESTGTTWEWQTCGGGGSLFTDGGATTYLTASTDNLGLGTSTANQALSIFRNGADAAVEFSTISGANEKWTVGIDDSDGAKFKISSSSALGTNDRFVINGNGDVGVGTASHDNQYKLAVRGDNTTSVVRFSMDAGGNSSTYNRFVGFTNQAFSLQYATMNVSSNAFQIQSNTNFDLKLDAVGSADDVLLQSVGTGKVGIGTSTPNRKLTVYNSTANSGVIGFENPSGAASIGTDTLGGFMQAGTANKGVWLYDNAATGFIGINGVSHKIGIGTTTPAATLDVYDGAIRAIADSTYQTVGYGKGLEMRYRTDSGLDNAEILSYDRSGGSSKGLLVAGSELRFDTPTNGLGWTLPDMTLTAAGNLGIGTTTPSAKLDVYNGVLRATGNGAVPTFGQGLEVGYVSGTYGQINSYNRSTSAFTQLRIDGLTTLINSGSGGNVGIGTTTASEKLSIFGNLLLTSTGRIYMPNNASIYARNAANSFYAPILALDSSNQLNLGETTASLATPIRFFTTGSATPNAVLTTGGNLGIGTTTPNQKLTVEGNLNLSSAIGAIYFDDTKYIYASSTNDSIVFGESAGAALTTTGLNNVVIGYQAMQVATTSDYMVAVGYQALKSLINSGASVGNTAVGYQTLSTNTYGGYNSSFGYQALFSNTTGSFNSASGFQSQYSNTTGTGNSSFGRSSLQSNTTGSNNTVFGTNAFNIATSTSNTVAVGYAALGSLITSGASVENTAIGYQTLTANTYGGRNTAVGHQSLFSNTTGSYNTAVGDYPLYGNTTGSHNIAIGYRALLNATTTSNTVAIGRNALENLRTAGVTVGNTAIGYLSQNGNYYGGQNTSLGYQALWQNYDGSKNTAVGNGALGGVSFNASNNTVFGYQAGDNITTGASNIIIGTDIDAISATASNRLNIGNLLFGTGIDGTGGTLSTGNIGIGTSTPNTKLYVLANSASTYSATFDNDGNNANRSGILVKGGLDDHTAAGPSTLIGFQDGDGTTVGSITFGSSVTAYNTTSDVRLKTNIVDTAVGLNELMQIQVRDFNWKADADKSTLTHGFIAQELAMIYPQAVTIPKNPNDIWMVDYSKLMPLVIAGVQDQNVTVTEQGVTLGSLGEQLLTTIKSVADLEAAVSSGLSENYHTEDETIEAGELVALATTSDATIRLAHKGDNIFGVVSENAGIILGEGMSSAKPVALTGRVKVKVNDEGGDIEIGDAITISTEEGIGTKATTTTRVIGTALEATNNDTDTIHIYVSPQMHYAWNETTAVASLFAPIENNENDTLWGRITTLASNFVDGVLSVTGIKTDELCVGDVCVDEGTFLKMVQDAGGNGQSNNNAGSNTDGEEVPPQPEPTEPPVYGPDPTEEPPVEIPPPEPEPEPVVAAPTEPAPTS